jgi:hypothetical protein
VSLLIFLLFDDLGILHVIFDDLGIIEPTQSVPQNITSFIDINRWSCWHIVRYTRCQRSYNDGFEIRLAIDAGECQEEQDVICSKLQNN